MSEAGVVIAIKDLARQLKFLRQSLTVDLGDGSRMSVVEYLGDQLRYLAEVVETHVVSPLPDNHELRPAPPPPPLDPEDSEDSYGR